MITIYALKDDELNVAIEWSIRRGNWKKKHKLPFRGGMTVSKDMLLISDFAGNFSLLIVTMAETNWSVL